MQNKNYYQILMVSRNASPKEITAAKNALAKKYHPDATAKDGMDTTGQMACILEAYTTLSDPRKRAEYDRTLGKEPVMQTFDLHETADAPEEDSDPVLSCWRAAHELYDIVAESLPLFHTKKKVQDESLTDLTIRALEQICILREAQISQQYWHPDTLNWLLFTHMKNKNYTMAYLCTLYDAHIKTDLPSADRRRLKKTTTRYLRDLDHLLSH